MEIPEQDLLAPVGQKASSAALARVAALLGEKPKAGANALVFPKAGLAYWRSARTGPLESVYWPAKPGGATTLAFPRGLVPAMTDGDVRALLGEPTFTPAMDFYLEDFPQDVFDLPKLTIQVAYDARAAKVRGVCMSTAAAAGEARRLRAASSRPLRPARPPSARAASAKAASAKRAASAGPQAPSAFDSFVARMRTGRKRRKPTESVLALLHRGTPDDLRTFLQAHAEHAHGPLDLGELRLDDNVTGDDVPARGAGAGPWRVRSDRVCIGRTGGGDLWVVERAPKGKAKKVFRVVHDDAWRELREAQSLEAFFARRAEEERQGRGAR